VGPARVQRPGDQAVAVPRGLGRLDPADPFGEDEVFVSPPLVGRIRSSTARMQPLRVAAGGLLTLAAGRPGAAWPAYPVALPGAMALPGAVALLVPGLPLLARADVGTGLSGVAVPAQVRALLPGSALPALDGLLVPGPAVAPRGGRPA
jgi:hypothetical protein